MVYTPPPSIHDRTVRPSTIPSPHESSRSPPPVILRGAKNLNGPEFGHENDKIRGRTAIFPPPVHDFAHIRGRAGHYLLVFPDFATRSARSGMKSLFLFPFLENLCHLGIKTPNSFPFGQGKRLINVGESLSGMTGNGSMAEAADVEQDAGSLLPEIERGAAEPRGGKLPPYPWGCCACAAGDSRSSRQKRPRDTLSRFCLDDWT